ncbi:glycosyltransferase [Sphingomonas corticis]|jgi:glycosyltransferase involved in cell wall biosynthesis|uniref:glycosyltransferase n=1 Tax=Sphingomonas corticis TaxID=2722791 RepID=UPI001ADD81D8|nr:glycosyltransferase [Sphingomonas corticis]
MLDRDFQALPLAGPTPAARVPAAHSRRAPRLRAVPAGRVPVTVGYLTNVYPAVSHSFIRREIRALEDTGVVVHRFSIRTAAQALPDPDDRAEQARTLVLLRVGIAILLRDTIVAMLSRPGRFAAAIGMSARMAHAAHGQWMRHLAYLVEACVLARLARERGIGHLHAHFGTNPAAVARLAHALGGPTYSLTIHGPEEFDAPAELSLFDKIADAAFTVAISQFGRAQLMRWSRRASWDRIAVVPCGVDDGFLNDVPPPDRAASRTFVCVARLDPQKGLSILIEAAARLAEREDFQLRIVGDGAMFTDLARMIRQHRLERHVVLLGWRSAAEIRAEIEGARAFVLSSFAEGLPVVLMEALALRCPVIATAVGGVGELVDRDCGWLVPAGTAEAIAEAMRAALAATGERLRSLGEEGRRRVLARHDAGANARALANLLSAHA